MTRKCHNFVIINSYTCTVYIAYSVTVMYTGFGYIYTLNIMENIAKQNHHGSINSNSILNYTSEISFSFCHFFHMIILSKFIGEMGFDTFRTRTLVISMWHGIISRLAENYNIICVIICFSFPESLRLCDYPIHFLCRINIIFYSLI